ncbi:NYN domain-containing protein [Staphylococcus simiae]|uniref:NYN domain-containing protein n=1 Tax=Staphylococcus simiae TaxID=308354 RepID=UPI001A9779B2|nr:NYN domain-containing protein [Staphylococcus simiae]MBO1199447.1 NYN domain-containing protein [Staphylococcus simiae]MBO1201751.1 NYN domain-containing protein [Staphylococcus simiae]MBO1203956.1 NYN domain-containing protein [Staphylococcus simiae]MBO1211434.1 NYN domain-containing protein [Staphylococcus simiae]MBO1230188.1 NYN domain-containing protein [Staphylococcus simiae]
MKERYLIIDGYNMIGQSTRLSAIAKENLEEARQQLLDTIANYSAVITDEVICVFDAYEQSGIEREYIYHGVKTIFTKEKETADSFIERYVYELYDKHTKHITVVTSDMSEQHAIFGSGAYRISSREMWRDLEESAIDVSKSLEDISENKPRTRIQLSSDILAKFEEIRRGDNKK